MKVQDVPEQVGPGLMWQLQGDAFQLSEKELSAPREGDRWNLSPSRSLWMTVLRASRRGLFKLIVSLSFTPVWFTAAHLPTK